MGPRHIKSESNGSRAVPDWSGDDDRFSQLQPELEMRDRKIAVTNEARIVPADGQQLAANGQLTPRPSSALVEIQDRLGGLVPVPSNKVIAASAAQAAKQTPINPISLDTSASAQAATNDATPKQYETTAE